MSIGQKLTKTGIPRQTSGRRAAPGLTAKRRMLFLAALAQSGVITEAAQAAGMSRGCVYTHRAKDPEFAREWDDSLLQFADSLEAAAHQRAVDGWLEPIFQGGELVGHARRYSDSLLLALLKAKRPEYRSTPPAQVVAIQQPKDRDPVRLARKIAFALAIAKKDAERGAG
ncbi:MAG: hypothetical protein HQM04_13305 [Magnetococcales bacterium]|nr:hypothetical protein [Magnetococcales bacterium]MBF0116002.1 hypothetical protein [Magnetococcales bacterium]